MGSSILQIKLTGHTNKDDIQVEVLSQTHKPKMMRQVRSDNVTHRLSIEAMESVGTGNKRDWPGEKKVQK